MYTLLLVDDQREILNALRRSLMQELDDWDIYTASGGVEALEMMNGIAFDVVITDIKMPEMNGVEFLETAALKHPATLRFVLSGYTERDLIYKTIGNVHQFLSKPIDTTVLVRTLERAISLRSLLNNEDMRHLAAGLKGLPSFPEIYQELMDALCATNVSLSEVSEIVQHDVGLTARVMHLVNSSFFGRSMYVSGPAHAVSLLGTEVMKGLVVSSYVFTMFDQHMPDTFDMRSFENHCVQVGTLAKRIAEEESGDQLVIDDAYTAGLLHEVGRLLIAVQTPHVFDQVHQYAIEAGIPLHQAEADILEATHAEIGAYLLGLWGFRHSIVEAVAFQYRLDECADKGVSALTALHLADRLLEQASKSKTSLKKPAFNTRYLEGVGLLHRLEYWQNTCINHINTHLAA